MSRDSIYSRVVRATMFVAVLSAVALAVVAGATAGVLWRSRENTMLAEMATGVRRAAEREAAEEGTPLEVAAPEALKDLATLGCQVEIWSGSRLLAVKPTGTPIGQSPDSPLGGWLTRTDEIGGGLRVLVAHPRDHEKRALGVFGLSLAVALPACLLFAWVTGRHAARRATRPLTEFVEIIGRIQTLAPAGLPASDGSPREVREVALAVQKLMERLSRSLLREIEFAGNASHELRTPLTRIRLLAERALLGANAEGRRELLEQVSEIDRMVRVADSLLVLARDPEGQLPRGEAVNFADLLRGAAEQAFRDGPESRLEIPDEAIVLGDEDLLRISVENLLDNAHKFALPGGAVQINVAEAGGFVRLAVSHPGAPIPDRERLFEKFYRGEEARTDRPGHGLGLSLSRHIARLHGGDVVCEDSPPGEVRFVLSLPAWQPAGVAAITASGAFSVR